MLRGSYSKKIEAGCDEAGRGCLAGPVVAASIILPKKFKNLLLNDSKKLSKKNRLELEEVIKDEAISWAVLRDQTCAVVRNQTCAVFRDQKCAV